MREKRFAVSLCIHYFWVQLVQMDKEDDKVSDDICDKNESTIAQPSPYIEIFLRSRNLVVFRISECDSKFMVKYFDKTKR